MNVSGTVKPVSGSCFIQGIQKYSDFCVLANTKGGPVCCVPSGLP